MTQLNPLRGAACLPFCLAILPTQIQIQCETWTKTEGRLITAFLLTIFHHFDYKNELIIYFSKDSSNRIFLILDHDAKTYHTFLYQLKTTNEQRPIFTSARKGLDITGTRITLIVHYRATFKIW